jgi:hypothetical protein
MVVVAGAEAADPVEVVVEEVVEGVVLWCL